MDELFNSVCFFGVLNPPIVVRTNVRLQPWQKMLDWNHRDDLLNTIDRAEHRRELLFDVAEYLLVDSAEDMGQLGQFCVPDKNWIGPPIANVATIIIRLLPSKAV